MCVGIAAVTRGRKGRTGFHPQLSECAGRGFGDVAQNVVVFHLFEIALFPVFHSQNQTGSFSDFLENALEH